MDAVLVLLVVVVVEALAIIVLAARYGRLSQPPVLTELSRSLQDAAVRIGEVASLTRSTYDVAASLERVMSGERTRGRLGELMLEHVLRESLPPESYLTQAMLGGQRVDFAVRVGDVLVPIDCKFPHAAYEGMLTAESEHERERYKTKLMKDVKEHINTVSRYVQPEHGTSEVALMYVPTESLYLAIIQDVDTIGYAHERKVVLCSPASIHYVLFLMGELVRRERLPEVLEKLNSMLEEIGSQLSMALNEYSTLERHLSNASSKSRELGGSLGALKGLLDSLERVRER